MDKIPCSVTILTFNSARTLARCLESVRDFSDIVVLDGGSADRTLEIAREYGARMYAQRENGIRAPITNFTAMRERAFSLAREDWQLWLDSDEWLSEEAMDKIREIVSGDRKEFLYSFLRKAVIGGTIIEYAYFYPEYCKRLFHKEAGVNLKGNKKVHEDLVAGKGISARKIDAPIYHAWLETYKDLIRKDDHYLMLTVHGKENFPLRKRLWIALINVLKAINVCVKSIVVYARHGFKKALPVTYTFRFIRYHLIYAKKILGI